ncbi:MAG: N-acetylmuramoyl-L-alanine amidase [Clostridia bacterium]|nr:N-acetylmuramoyl-L-alanine amidase [Clostridia bacterium]
MFKLALNAGHGYNTAGKRCLKSIDPNETREYTLNKRICDKIQTALKEYDGIEVLRIDDGSELSISTRAIKANNFGADFYLAIHHNAGINGGNGGGTEAYVYLKVDEKTKQWQSEIYHSVVASTGLKGNRSQPLRQADLGECRETRMPAVLVECGFMDSTSDTPIILTDEFATKVANACVGVIAKQAGATKTVTVPVSAKPVQTVKSAEQIAEEVIRGLWGNGEERKQRLLKAGYDYSAIQPIVNARLEGTSAPSKKSNQEIAQEVIKGLWGNGTERKQKLADAGYDYAAVQGIVNNLLK